MSDRNNADFDNEILYGKKSSDGFITVALIVEAVILAAFVIINQFLFSCVVVSGSSMNPTLETGDVLIMNIAKECDYGDVVVIDGKKKSGTDKDGNAVYEWLIKRVIAKGGDTVDIKDGGVWLKKFGEAEFSLLEEDYVSAGNITEKNGEGIKKYPFIVPDGEIFFLGDNRGNSSDSRYYGTCKESQIIGVVDEFAIKTKGFLTGINNFTLKIKTTLRRNGKK